WHPRAVEGILVDEQGLRGHQYEFRADEPRLRGRPDGQGQQLRRKAGVSFLAAAVEKDSRLVDHFARSDAGRADARRDEGVSSRPASAGWGVMMVAALRFASDAARDRLPAIALSASASRTIGTGAASAARSSFLAGSALPMPGPATRTSTNSFSRSAAGSRSISSGCESSM